MTRQRRAVRRGAPLRAMAVLLGGWTALRVVAWSMALPPMTVPPMTLATEGGTLLAGQSLSRLVLSASGISGSGPNVRHLKFPGSHVLSVLPQAKAGADGWKAPLLAAPRIASGPLARPIPEQPLASLSPVILPPVAQANVQSVPVRAPVPQPRLVGGHQLLWLAAAAQMPFPADLMMQNPTRPSVEPLRDTSAPAHSMRSRWSADGWLLLRQGGAGSSAAAFAGSYGASQVGAVVRYRLDPASTRRADVYLRASAALAGMSRDQEAALGLSVRPFARLPILAMAEVRATRSPAGTRLRPAAALVTQLPPVALPGKVQADLYVQTGYVGGAGATAFADGQLHLDRKVIDLGTSTLRAGGGLWGGAQKGAARLDVGPSASLSLRIGDSAGARLGLDWRFRVAGHAAPASGPALTLSAGF